MDVEVDRRIGNSVCYDDGTSSNDWSDGEFDDDGYDGEELYDVPERDESTLLKRDDEHEAGDGYDENEFHEDLYDVPPDDLEISQGDFQQDPPAVMSRSSSLKSDDHQCLEHQSPAAIQRQQQTTRNDKPRYDNHDNSGHSSQSTDQSFVEYDIPPKSPREVAEGQEFPKAATSSPVISPRSKPAISSKSGVADGADNRSNGDDNNNKFGFKKNSVAGRWPPKLPANEESPPGAELYDVPPPSPSAAVSKHQTIIDKLSKCINIDGTGCDKPSVPATVADKSRFSIKQQQGQRFGGQEGAPAIAEMLKQDNYNVPPRRIQNDRGNQAINSVGKAKSLPEQETCEAAEEIRPARKPFQGKPARSFMNANDGLPGKPAGRSLTTVVGSGRREPPPLTAAEPGPENYEVPATGEIQENYEVLGQEQNQGRRRDMPMLVPGSNPSRSQIGQHPGNANRPSIVNSGRREPPPLTTAEPDSESYEVPATAKIQEKFEVLGQEQNQGRRRDMPVPVPGSNASRPQFGQRPANANRPSIVNSGRREPPPLTTAVPDSENYEVPATGEVQEDYEVVDQEQNQRRRRDMPVPVPGSNAIRPQFGQRPANANRPSIVNSGRREPPPLTTAVPDSENYEVPATGEVQEDYEVVDQEQNQRRRRDMPVPVPGSNAIRPQFGQRPANANRPSIVNKGRKEPPAQTTAEPGPENYEVPATGEIQEDYEVVDQEQNQRRRRDMPVPVPGSNASRPQIGQHPANANRPPIVNSGRREPPPLTTAEPDPESYEVPATGEIQEDYEVVDQEQNQRRRRDMPVPVPGSNAIRPQFGQRPANANRPSIVNKGRKEPPAQTTAEPGPENYEVPATGEIQEDYEVVDQEQNRGRRRDMPVPVPGSNASRPQIGQRPANANRPSIVNKGRKEPPAQTTAEPGTENYEVPATGELQEDYEVVDQEQNRGRRRDMPVPVPGSNASRPQIGQRPANANRPSIVNKGRKEPPAQTTAEPGTESYEVPATGELQEDYEVVDQEQNRGRRRDMPVPVPGSNASRPQIGQRPANANRPPVVSSESKEPLPQLPPPRGDKSVRGNSVNTGRGKPPAPNPSQLPQSSPGLIGKESFDAIDAQSAQVPSRPSTLGIGAGGGFESRGSRRKVPTPQLTPTSAVAPIETTEPQENYECLDPPVENNATSPTSPPLGAVLQELKQRGNSIKGTAAPERGGRFPPEGQEKQNPVPPVKQNPIDQILNNVITGLEHPTSFNSPPPRVPEQRPVLPTRPGSVRDVPRRPSSPSRSSGPVLAPREPNSDDHIHRTSNSPRLPDSPGLPPRPGGHHPRLPQRRPSEEVLDSQPWFKGNMDRKESEVTLRRIGTRLIVPRSNFISSLFSENGGFLVRNTTKIIGYTISIYYQGEIRHLHIPRKGNKFILGSCEDQEFDSVIQLVQHYRSTKIDLKKGGSTLLVSIF
eukprot:gene5257-5921_t